MKNPLIPVWIGTAYLLIFLCVLHFVQDLFWAFLLFFLSPWVVIWMVITVLKSAPPKDNKPFNW